MWDEDRYYYDLVTKLLDAYTIDEILEISETDPTELLVELIRTRQININISEFFSDD